MGAVGELDVFLSVMAYRNGLVLRVPRTADFSQTIAIANQKGGTAKTTTTAALGEQLSRHGIPTHLIDMDPHADLTAAFGMHDEDNGLWKAINTQQALPVVPVEANLTISPSSLELLGAETEFLAGPSREFVLRSALAKHRLPKRPSYSSIVRLRWACCRSLRWRRPPVCARSCSRVDSSYRRWYTWGRPRTYCGNTSTLCWRRSGPLSPTAIVAAALPS
jgi:hypothetical protein